MIIGTNILSLILMMILGKRLRRMGMAQYAVVAVCAIVQTIVAAVSMFTAEMPPLR